MSGVRIALQPPPNVDFVVGYPGIPPGARDRPQASVKGAVEVRVGPAGIKAKWVRVELKKIETLPGGSQANSYFDHIGPSPVFLWQSSEDYSLLHSQDFPFLIRIPESIPPSIALERGAGIRYELVATVCTMGKGGFFRRRQTAVASQATTIIIDKHELHSTWPVYSQPESRSVHQDGVHLTVERGRTCYGPGDRVSVTAILTSDAAQPVVLRGFEFTLKETTIFRAGPQATAKRSGPQVKTANIGEQKVPLNVTLYTTTQHKAELGCLIPNTHTTTTLNAARHIDITYVIIVRAWIGAMQSIMMELPVIVSNWPRNVSAEAIRRIGVAPSLCVTSSPAATVPITTSVTRPLTGDSTRGGTNGFSAQTERASLAPPKQSVQYSTAPSGHNGTADHPLEADELGGLTHGSGSRPTGTVHHPGYGGGSSNRPSSRGELGDIQEQDDGAGVGVDPRTSRRRPSAMSGQNRFTITNYSEKDAAEGINPQVMRAAQGQAQPSSTQTQTQTLTSRPSARAWLSAEDEKKKLYENAVAKVQKVQGAAAMASATAASDMSRVNSVGSVTPSKKPAHWPTAEEEKVRLYDHAQATAKRTQAFGVSSQSTHSRSSSEANSPSLRDKPSSSSAAPGPGMSAGEALYQHAVSSMSKHAHVPHSSSAPPSPPLSMSSPRNMPHYPSAEEEKAALKRYHEAKLAVDRSHNTQYATREGITGSSSSSGAEAPISYDSLYPQPNGPSGGAGGSGGSDMPPPFEPSGSGSRPQYMNEKERLRRQYEAQDAVALAAQAQGTPGELHTSPSYTPRTPAYHGLPPQENGLSEKEILRRRLEEQDRVAHAMEQLQQQQQHLPQNGPPQPPPRANSARAAPLPPAAVNGFMPLTAAEEKAQLRARYEAGERESPGVDSVQSPAPRHPYAGVPAPFAGDSTPPPLMPRPPVEYIQETQEADMRARYYDSLGVGLAEVLDAEPLPSASGSMRVASPGAPHNPQLEIRPFSPIDLGLGYEARPALVSSGSGHGHGWPPPPPPPPPQAQY